MVGMFVTLCCLFFVGTPAPALSQNVNISQSQIDVDTLLHVFGSPTQLQATQPELPKEQFYLNNAEYDNFDWSLAKRITAMSNESYLLSPLGLKLALAILHEAATGQTQAELASVLNFDPDPNVVRKRFSVMLESLQTPSSHFVLNLGSRIYLEDSIEPQQRFAAIAQQFYKTEMKRVDFNNATVAANDINGWINNLTLGRIPALVSEDDVGNIVVLVLSAIYFKGTWVHPFPPNATKPDSFYVTPTIQKSVPFMSVRDKFYYAESVTYDAKILRMPYLGNKFSMYVLVPNSITGVDQLMSALNTKNLKSESLYLREYIVDVKLPKFTFDYAAVLDNVLYDLGIRQAFEDTASFPGISRGQSLKQKIKISKVLQRSGIEVNEVGSVAYSATEISLVNKFGEDTDGNQEVIVNRPFIFYIQDDDTRQVLFSGRIMDPTVKGGVLKYA